MAQIDGAGQQDTDDQNAETLQAALAQRQVTLQGQPQGGSDVPSHENSDPVRRIGNSTPHQALTEKRRVPCIARLVQAASTDKDAIFPVHPGAKAFYDGDEKTLMAKDLCIQNILDRKVFRVRVM